MIQAPFVTSLRIDKLSANQVSIRWDDVGSNFYYFVEIAETHSSLGVALAPENYSWRNLGYTPNNDWFEESVSPLTYYKMRVSVAANGFERSEWIETEEFQTFATNAYTFETMQEFTLSKKFIEEKFSKNNSSYVDFNRDLIYASLMNEGFQFSPEYTNLSAISNFIVGEDEYHEVQGPIEKVCVSKNRTMLMHSDDVLYLFERFQPVVKVSNDKGQNWHYIKLFNDRIGNPVSRVCTYQSKTTTYAIGYDRLFYGRLSNDVRWSADDVKFSAQDITFAKIGDHLNLGFNVEIFGTYAKYPADIAKYVEAMTCNDDYLYLVARDTVRYIKLKNAPVDPDPASPTFGEKLFETKVLNITGNNKSVVFKMDSVGGKIFALVTGEVKQYGQDPTKPSNVIKSETAGVYVLRDNNTFERIFGNTPEERKRIEHGWSSMSTDGKEIFISGPNFEFTEFAKDIKLINDNDNVNDAVKIQQSLEWHSDKHYHMMTFRAGEDSDYESFKPAPMRYYAEPYFAWSRREGSRAWITTNDHAAVVYSDLVYTKPIEEFGAGSPNRIVHENWNKGTGKFICPNVQFTGFIKYASGVLFHKSDGTIIGYYEYNYRVRDEAIVFWKPSLTMFSAYLQNQEREIPWAPEVTNKERDPDLRPLLNTMMPDTYLLEDSNFEKFCEYYLQFLSDGYGTHYNNLLNLVKNKYPREEDAWEYLWSEVYKRNIYLSKKARDNVSRFFEARKADFYATKGIEDSYKFLFKVLYNEDVQIDIESKNTTEYDIIVDSDNISQDIVGRTIYTKTGRSNVTYIERHFSEGKLQWRITIHNLLGRFIVGQEIKSETTSFVGMIVQGVRGKELLTNNIDYINRNRSYYVMKITSALPTSRYREDVLRFVHPVGFGFIGITLLTMFINTGLSMKHVETIINKLKNYKWDAGLPLVYPDRVLDLDINGNPIKDSATGEFLYRPYPNAGAAFPLPPNYDSENNSSKFYGTLPSQRRKALSPTFDQSAVAFSNYRNLVDKRLKDDNKLPRDPVNPTQVKVDE